MVALAITAALRGPPALAVCAGELRQGSPKRGEGGCATGVTADVARLTARGESQASHRDGRGAPTTTPARLPRWGPRYRTARRPAGGAPSVRVVHGGVQYREYLSEEQRSRRGCIACRMQPAFHHGLLGSAGSDRLVDVIGQLSQARGCLVADVRDAALWKRWDLNRVRHNQRGRNGGLGLKLSRVHKRQSPSITSSAAGDRRRARQAARRRPRRAAADTVVRRLQESSPSRASPRKD